VDHFFGPEDTKRARFDKSSSFQCWMTSEKSGVFLLVGYSEYGIVTHQNYCWTSPIAIDLIQGQQASKSPHAYALLPSKGSANMRKIILSLLSQLLSFQTEKLREEDVSRELELLYSEVVKSSKDWELDASLEKLSQFVLGLIPVSQTVHIIVDRLDRLDPCEADDRIAFLRILAQAAQTTECVVKVFVVISGSDWIFQPSDLREFGEFIVIHKERQERLSDQDDY